MMNVKQFMDIEATMEQAPGLVDSSEEDTDDEVTQADLDFVDDRDEEDISEHDWTPKKKKLPVLSPIKKKRKVAKKKKIIKPTALPKKKQKGNACYIWHVTVPDTMDPEEIKRALKQHCKKWTFQLEKGDGDNGYTHYQIVLSLKTKKRMLAAKADFEKLNKDWSKSHWSPARKEGMNDFSYAEKEASRVLGPWKHDDPVIFIPRQIQEIKDSLYDWQRAIVDSSRRWEPRVVNCLVDRKGNIGKSVLAGYMRSYLHPQDQQPYGLQVPYQEDSRDLNRCIMGMPTAKCYLIDMPRATKEESQVAFYAGIESIKNGYVYDDRYKFRSKAFDSPVVWVFTNKRPTKSLLSRDRWRFWEVDDNKQLVRRIDALLPVEEGFSYEPNLEMTDEEDIYNADTQEAPLELPEPTSGVPMDRSPSHTGSSPGASVAMLEAPTSETELPPAPQPVQLVRKTNKRKEREEEEAAYNKQVEKHFAKYRKHFH